MRPGAGLALVVSVAASDTPLAATRTALEEWVQTRQVIARTRADWAADRALLEQNAALLERELAGLREQLTRVETNQSAVAEQRAALLPQQTQHQEAQNAVRARLAELERQVRRLEPVFPPALLTTIQPLLSRLPSGPVATNLALVPRALTLVTLLNEVDKFNGALSVSEETRPGPDGREVAVEVLYAGLAQAWFVSKSGNLAGVGVPEAAGWQWTVRNELAPAVARAIRMYRNELPPEFVAVPLQLR
jgi:hypothetical protein